MSMQLIKRSAQALGAAALFCSLPAFSATITPTGGSVSYMTPSTVPASYGSFSASQQETMWSGSTPVLTDVTLATLSGNFSANSLELSGYATTEFDAVDGFPHFGVIRGTLGFDLSDTSPMRFALSQATSGGAFNMYAGHDDHVAQRVESSRSGLHRSRRLLFPRRRLQAQLVPGRGFFRDSGLRCVRAHRGSLRAQLLGAIQHVRIR